MISKRIECERNRRIVQNGLDRRRASRHEAQVEADLEAFENAMISRLNSNYADAVWQGICNKLEQDTRTECDSRISRRAKRRAATIETQKDIVLGCLSFFAFAVLMFWLTTWTYFPIWGATLYSLGAAVFLAMYLLKINANRHQREEKNHEQFRNEG